MPVQSSPHDLEMTNVVLVMGLKVAKAAVVILELPLDKHVRTITVVSSLETHLIVVATLRCGHVIKSDLHWFSPRQVNACALTRGRPSAAD